MAKKVLKKITLMTLPNGYSLDIEGNGFMYFNELDLLLGFLSHIGTDKTTDMEKGDLLNALFSMMLGHKYQNDVDRLKMTVNRLETRYTDVTAKLGRELDKVKEANEKHDKLMKRIAQLTDLVDEMQQCYQEACKPYEEYNNRINTLENKTTSMESHFNSATAESQMLLKLIREKYHELLDLTNKLSSRGDMMIGRMINQVNKNAANMAEQQKSGDEGGDAAEFQPAGEAAGTTADGPAADAAGSVAGEAAVVAEAADEQPADDKPKRKGGRSRKADGDKKPRAKAESKTKGETPRQKRDKAILEKMMKDNPNIK